MQRKQHDVLDRSRNISPGFSNGWDVLILHSHALLRACGRGDKHPCAD